jgi:hypothetical protein
VVHSGDKLEVPGEEVVRITDVRTNLPDTTPISITMAGRTVRWQRHGVTGIDASKLGGREVPLEVTRGGRSIGTIWVKQGREFFISSGKKKPYSPILPVQYTPEN